MEKKKIMIVVFVLIIYFIIMVIIYGFDRVKNKFYHIDMILTPNTYISYENGHFNDLTDTSILGKNYQIYENHKFLYQGVLQYTNEKWYAFDNNQPLSLPEDFLAYQGNTKIDIIDFKEKEMSKNEISEAKKILAQEGILFEPIFTKTQKIEVDINNDKKGETIYIISNTLGMEEQESYFSIAYIKIKNKIHILSSNLSKDMYNVPSLTLKEIIDFEKNKKYELLFRKIYFDQIGTCYEIFGIEKKDYQLLKECELIKRGDVES